MGHCRVHSWDQSPSVCLPLHGGRDPSQAPWQVMLGPTALQRHFVMDAEVLLLGGAKMRNVLGHHDTNVTLQYNYFNVNFRLLYYLHYFYFQWWAPILTVDSIGFHP